MNVFGAVGVAVRELQTTEGPDDYILFVDGKLVGVIEAKRDEEGVRLTQREDQTERYRTNTHFTLKTNPLKFEYLAEFIECYRPADQSKRAETWSEENPEGRWRKYTYDEIIARDKASLDLFWLKDKLLSDLDSLPEPKELAEAIVANLETAIASFREIEAGLAEA